jgi:hypothetical protein
MVRSVSDSLELWKMFAKHHFDTSLFLVALAVVLLLCSNGGVTCQNST